MQRFNSQGIEYNLVQAAMFNGASPWVPAGRPLIVSFCLFSFVIALTIAPAATARTKKATVASASLAPTSFPQWTQDLGYQKTQIHPLALAATGCPVVDANVSGVTVPLMLDSGTARGFIITNSAPPIPHHVLERREELNPDGSHRGESYGIRVDTMSVLGQAFRHVEGSLADWRMFSSEPFNGTVGLDFFLHRRLTLDYRSMRIATASSPLPERLDPRRYISIKLLDPPKSQGHILYVRAKVNGREAIVYLDTGRSVSFISSGFAEGLPRVERPGNSKVFSEEVSLELGGQKFVLNDLRESSIHRGSGFDLPVALELGSDVLSRFIVTIDIPEKELVLGLAESPSTHH